RVRCQCSHGPCPNGRPDRYPPLRYAHLRRRSRHDVPISSAQPHRSNLIDPASSAQLISAAPVSQARLQARTNLYRGRIGASNIAATALSNIGVTAAAPAKCAHAGLQQIARIHAALLCRTVNRHHERGLLAGRTDDGNNSRTLAETTADVAGQSTHIASRGLLGTVLDPGNAVNVACTVGKASSGGHQLVFS